MSTRVTHFPKAGHRIQAAFDEGNGFVPVIRVGHSSELTLQWSAHDLDVAIAHAQQIAEQADWLRRQLVQYVEENQPGRAAYAAERARMNGTPDLTHPGVSSDQVPASSLPVDGREGAPPAPPVQDAAIATPALPSAPSRNGVDLVGHLKTAVEAARERRQSSSFRITEVFTGETYDVPMPGSEHGDDEDVQGVPA